MRSEDLHLLHSQLRQELDAAYSARPWDSARINRIAEDLSCLERTLAETQDFEPARAAPRPASVEVEHRK
jgi:hypothetical protein